MPKIKSEKVVGVIAEFNPFHKGHQFLLDAAGEAVKIVAMSGNWMQRGEPAIVDKWARAEMALKNGADLVVELPSMVSLQGADFFAAGAVDILSTLGIDTLLFGSETTTDYQRISDIYAEKSEEMAAFIQQQPDYLSYPQKAERAWEKFAGVKFDGGTPNHILGLAYAKAVAGKNIQLETLQRQVNYNSPELSGTFASASAIRQGLQNGQDISPFVPENVLPELLASPKVSWDNYFDLLKYRITLGHLTDIFHVNEELSHRLSAAIKGCQTISELEAAVYTKRYTRGHIRRVLAYILLGVPRNFELPSAIHVLGFTAKGRAYLAKIRSDELQILTKIGQYPWDSLTQGADEIYRLGNSNIPEQTYGRKPIMVDFLNNF